MNKSILTYLILLSLLLCFIPAEARTDNTVTGSFSVGGNPIIGLAVINPDYTTLTLSWTSPQNSYNWGPASQYDIRYSLSPITSDDAWNSAIQLSGEPVPKPPGSQETLLVIGLIPCTTYYFAIKAADGTGAWTPLSNSPQGTTLCISDGGGGGGGGGIEGGGPASGFLPPATTCPLTLVANMQGNITTASMTENGVLCEPCLARDSSGKNTLEIDKDTKLVLAGSVVPTLLKVSTSSTSLPTAENTVIISPVYEFNAYATAQDTAPEPVVITPSARLILNYDMSQLPENTTEVYIANYDTTQGWLALTPVPGAVAEIGKAHGLLNHFSIFAVLATVEEPLPPKFEVSNLTINPSQIQPNQDVNISVNVVNTGGKSSDYSLELKVDGVVKSSTQMTMEANDSQRINFTTTSNIAGKHQVEIAGLIGEFEVINATPLYNWWLIASIIGIIIVLGIWGILGWRWYQERKKATAISGKETSDSK